MTSIVSTGSPTRLVPPSDSTTAVQILKADGASPILTADSTNSRIGIGTVTPEAPLHVANNSPSLFERSYSTPATALRLANPDTTDGNACVLGFHTDTTGVEAVENQEVAAISAGYTVHNHLTRTSDLRFWTTNSGAYSEKMRLTGLGRLGIGTVAPSSPLDVRNGPTGVRLNEGATPVSGYFFDLRASDTGAEVATNSDIRPLIFKPNNSESVRFLTNGRVGIGTATPAATLEVNGACRLTPLSSPPSSPVEGTLYFDSGTKKLRVYDGTAWRDCW